MGRKAVSANCLEYLFNKPGVEIIGVLTDNHLDTSPTANAAQRLHIPILDFDKSLLAAENGELEFDLGISMLFWRKLKGRLLTVPSRGIINFHPAPLPTYKGTAGYNLAILEGLSEWAVSAHYVDHEIDTGAIIDVSYFPINCETETAKSLEAKSQHRLFEQFVHVAEKALNASSLLSTTPNVGGRYVTRSEMESMKEVRPGDDVARKIRAFWFPPYDGAFMMVNGIKCTLIDRTILTQLADPSNSSLFTSPAPR